MTNSSVAAIVINWRLPEQTERCLQSLEQLDHPCRVLVVDNGSDDGSVQYLAQRRPRLELIALPHNSGFAAACNRAIAHVLADPACEYVLLLNNDAVIHAHALAELLTAGQAHPEAGIFGPKVYYSRHPARIWYAGARRRRGVLAAVDTGRGQTDRGQFDALREVDYVFGAAMFIRRSVFERIGLLDERFFLYLEDLDFCLRAQEAGFKLLYVPGAVVWHEVSASTANNEAARKYHIARSTWRFLTKHSPSGIGITTLAFWSLVFLRALAVEIGRADIVCLRSYWSGLIDAMTEHT